MRWIKIFLVFLVFLASFSLFGAPLEETLKEHISYESDQVNKFGYLFISRDQPIGRSTFINCQLAIDHFKKEKVRAVLLHLDTPGGELFSTLQIVKLLHRLDKESSIPVIAFIDTWALSAGAILSYASRFIGVTERSLMGAAEPVQMDATGQASSASEKVNSALRAEIGTLASYYGRNPLIAQAMVDKDILLVERQDKILALEKESELEASDRVISPKGKLLTLNGSQLMGLHVADFSVGETLLPPITSQEQKSREWPASKSLAFQMDFLKNIPNAVLVSYHDWKVDLINFLTNPFVTSLMMMGLVLGFYFEISTPGFGFPGAIALTCLALVLFSHFALEVFNWIELIMIFVGLGLVVLELFVVPVMGILFLLGGLLFFAGLALLLLPNFSGFSWPLVESEFFERIAYLGLGLVLAFVAIGILVKFLSKRAKFLRGLVAQEPQEEIVEDHLPEIGKEGIAYTNFRPSGKIDVDGRIYDALTLREFIDKGEKLVIIGHQGYTLLVRKKS